MGFMDSFKAAKAAPPMPAKKPGVEVAIGLGKGPMDPMGKDPAAADPKPAGGLTDAQHVAAKSAMQALQDGDVETFGRALKVFCGGEDYDDADDDKGDDDKGDSLPIMPGK